MALTTEQRYEQTQKFMRKAVWQMGRVTVQKRKLNSLQFFKKDDVEILKAINELAKYRSELNTALKLLYEFLAGQFYNDKSERHSEIGDGQQSPPTSDVR